MRQTTSSRGLILAVAALALLLLAPASASAGGPVLHVNSSADPGDGVCDPVGMGDGCTLRDAIDDAVDGYSIVIDPGVDPALNALLTVNETLDIRGQGAAATTISKASASQFRAFTIGGVGKTVEIIDLKIDGFHAPDGLTQNPATSGDEGGAIFHNADSLTLDGVRLTNNHAGDGGDDTVDDAGGEGGHGGAIFAGGPLRVENSTIDGNFAGDGGTAVGGSGNAGEGGNGGGVSAISATIINSTISGNQAGDGGATIVPARGGDGGGIITSGPALKMLNSTISGNSAGDGSSLLPAGGGGGVYAETTEATLDFVTIAGNTSGSGTNAGYGGGIINEAVTLTLRNTLLAGNTLGTGAGAVGPNCAGPDPVDGLHNLQFPDDPACPMTFATGNPQLGGLANNGGPTQTRALGPGSAALNQVPTMDCTDLAPVPLPLTTDQRGSGFPRMPTPFGGACDIGAFEVQPPPPPSPPVTTPTLTPTVTPVTAPPATAKKCKKGRKLKKGKCVKKKKKK